MTANAPATFVARSRRPSSNCAIVASVRSSARRNGRPSSDAATAAIERRLVVAAPALTIDVDGDRHHEVGPDADPSPASRDGLAERLGEPPLAAVLQVVEGGPNRTGERGAPLQLQERRRDVRGQADRRSGRQPEPRVDRGQARLAQRPTFASAAGTRRRESEIERAGDETPQAGHGRMMRGPPALPVGRRP